MSEADLYNVIRLAVTEHGGRVFRNNVGLFTTDHGTKIMTGLCEGSSDLIGWTKLGRFLAIEVKSPTGKLTKEQLAFLKAVIASGGVGIVARSVKDVTDVLRGELWAT